MVGGKIWGEINSNHFFTFQHFEVSIYVDIFYFIPYNINFITMNTYLLTIYFFLPS